MFPKTVKKGCESPRRYNDRTQPLRSESFLDIACCAGSEPYPLSIDNVGIKSHAWKVRAIWTVRKGLGFKAEALARGIAGAVKAVI